MRQRALETLNWRIRRVWSTDWWMNAAAALDKLHARLLADLEDDRAQRAAAAAAPLAVVEPEAPQIEDLDDRQPEAPLAAPPSDETPTGVSPARGASDGNTRARLRP